MFTEIITEKETGHEAGHLPPSGACMPSWHVQVELYLSKVQHMCSEAQRMEGGGRNKDTERI